MLTYVTNLTLDAFGLRHKKFWRKQETDHWEMDTDADEARAGCWRGMRKLVHYGSVASIYMENFSKYRLKDVEPYDGIRELLASLKKRWVYMWLSFRTKAA